MAHRPSPPPSLFFLCVALTLALQLKLILENPLAPAALHAVAANSAAHAAAMALVSLRWLGDCEAHRTRLPRLRKWLADLLPGEKCTPLNDAPWTNGPAGVITRLLYGVILLMLSAVYMLESGANIKISAIMALFCSGAIAVVWSRDLALTNAAMIMHTMIQTNNLLVTPRRNDVFYERAFFMNLLGSLLCLEPLDLLMLRTLHVGHVIASVRNGHAIFTPSAFWETLNLFTINCLLTLIVISVLGARGRLAAMLMGKRFVGFVFAITVPSALMLLSFSFEQKAWELKFSVTSTAGIVVGGVGCIAAIHLHRTNFMSRVWPLLPLPRFLSFSSMAQWLVTLLALAWRFRNKVGQSHVLVIWLVCASAPTLWLSQRLPGTSRLLVLLVHVGWLLAMNCVDEVSFVFLIVRQVIFFDDSPFALVAAQEFMVMTALICLAEPSQTPNLCLTLFSAIMGGLMTKNARHTLETAVDIEAKSGNFVNHALKQKLVGAGFAIGQALELAQALGSPNSNQASAAYSGDLHKVLQAALQECQHGADMCHFSSVARLIEKGNYENKIVALPLHAGVALWRDRMPGVDFVVDLRQPDSSLDPVFGDDVIVEVDWDLCFGLICKSVSGGVGSCVVRLSRELALLLEVTSPGREGTRVQGENKRIAATLIRYLGGESLRVGLWRVPVAIHRAQAAPPLCQSAQVHFNFSASKPVLLTRAPPELPPGLSFAILDDNLLSRRFVSNFCTGAMKCKSCLIMGDTAEEVEQFMSLVNEQDPDVVMLDLHLDWGGSGDVLGSQVAQMLRQRGYQGCIVLHTASSMVRQQVGMEALDGIMPKSLNSTADKLQVMATAYARAQRRRARLSPSTKR